MGLFQKIQKYLTKNKISEIYSELRWLGRYMHKFRLTIFVHILLGILSILLGLASSVASKYLIDAVTGFQSNLIGTAAAWMVGMMVAKVALRAASSRISAFLDIRVHNDLQVNVYRQILRADWQSLEPYASGDLLNRLNSDVSTVSGGVVNFIPSFLASLVQFVGTFAIMIYYDPTMALIALMGVPISVFCSRFMMRKLRTYNKQLKESSSTVMSFQQDSFQNLTSIKAFGLSDFFCDRMTSVQEKYRSLFLSYNRFSVWASAFLSVVGMVASVSCFGWSVYRLWTRMITYGTMTLFLQLSSVLSSSFSSIVGLVPSFISLTTSAGRIISVTELPAEEQDIDEAFSKEESFSISLSHVSFSYQDGNTVLKDATIEAANGDLVALTGSSGEGKTTVLRILLGLVSAEEGSAQIIGNSGRSYPLSAATRSAFSYVPQGGSLFPGTIRSNMLMAVPEAKDQDIWQALYIACADHFVKELPLGLDHPLGGRDAGLSAGQCQRLAIARAILRGAPILLLDEATSALDNQTEAQMLDRLMNCGKIRTCILVTHRTRALQYCTRSYSIQNGYAQEVE